jgi:hypothetical protein
VGRARHWVGLSLSPEQEPPKLSFTSMKSDDLNLPCRCLYWRISVLNFWLSESCVEDVCVWIMCLVSIPRAYGSFKSCSFLYSQSPVNVWSSLWWLMLSNSVMLLCVCKIFLLIYGERVFNNKDHNFLQLILIHTIILLVSTTNFAG